MPTDSTITLAVFLKGDDTNDIKLAERRLISEQRTDVTAEIHAQYTRRPFTITCALRNVPRGATVPTPFTRYITILEAGTVQFIESRVEVST